MNFIKKWLGIYHIDHRIQEMQIEINELKKASESDRDHIVKLSTMILDTPKVKTRRRPGPKSKKKKLPSSQETV